MLQIWLPLNGHLNNQGLNSTNGTWVGSSSYDNNGKIGKCVSCNSSHYVICPYNFLSTNKFSQAFWIYIPSTLGNCGLLETVQMIPGYSMLWTDYNKLKIYGENNQLWWLPADIFYDKWVHLAIIHTGTKILLYINGVIYGKATSNSSAISSGTIYLGNGIDTTYGPVKFCDYRLYDSVLSSKQVHEIAKGLVLHYPMNDLYVLSTVYDCSGYCNNGTVTGSLQVVDDSPRYRKSSRFGTYLNPYVEINPSFLPSISNGTVSWWFKPTTSGNHLLLTGQDSVHYIAAGNSSTNLYHNLVGSPVLYVDGIRGNSTYKDGWHHYCLVGVNFLAWTKMYINNYSSDWPLNGLVSDLRIYSTALSEEDVKELYNTSAIINNNNTLEAYEFAETTTYSINKSGVLEGAEFIEQDEEVLINNTEQVFATEFTEI